MAYVDELLGRDEKIICVARQHLLTLISRVLGEILLIAILILAGVVSWGAFQNQLVNGFAIGQAVLLFCTTLSVILLASMVLDYLRWNNAQYIVTDRRVIRIEGVFNKTVMDSSLGKINDVLLSQSWLGRLLDFGTVEILTASDEGANRMEYIVQPIGFKHAMMEAKRYYDQGFGYFDTTPVASYVQPAQDVHSMLRELASLRDRGILSSDEFEAKKRELLSRI